MSRKKLWLITILILSIRLLSSPVFAQETQDDPFEIWPVFNGSGNIYVPEGQNIVIRTSFIACARPLSKNWTKFDRVTLSMDGNSMVSSAKESKSYWSDPYAIPNEGVPCVNDSDKLWVVDWAYDLGALPAGTYPVHFTENIRGIFTDGADYDGDGFPDLFSWHINVDFNIIVIEMGSISGQVINQETGTPLEGILVAACEVDVYCDSVRTDANGNYEIFLPPGTYRVGAHHETDYVSEYYEEKMFWDEADDVFVIAGEETPDINFTLVEFYTPGFLVNLTSNEVQGWEWIAGTVVSATIHTPGPSGTEVFSQTATVEAWGTEPWETDVVISFPPELGVGPGYQVALTDGNTTKEHIVTSLTVLEVSEENDTVSGMADGGVEVFVDAWQGANRRVVANADGFWMADFSVPGTEDWEQDIIDIVPGSGGGIHQYDEDGDSTHIIWWLEEPYEPRPGFLVNLTSSEVHGWEWNAGVPVTLTIDAPGTEWTQIYSGTALPEQQGSEPWETFTWFSFPPELGVGPGYRVTLTDGNTTKEHIVTYLVAFDADADNDTVSGMADPYTEVIVDSWLGANRLAIADVTGFWIVDFSVPGTEDWEQDIVDLRPGDGGGINQYDEDGDSTNINWWVPNTRLDAWPDADYVDAWDWVAGEPLTITIDNPDIPGIEYTETQIPEYPDWDPNQTYAQFYFAGSFDLQPGFIVTLENELKTKQHIVTSLAITGFDLTADLVWGIANPEVDIWIWVCDDTGCATRHAFTDGLGNWIVNFAETGAEPYEDVIWDLVPGSSGSAAEPDADNDATLVDWWVSE